MGRLAMGAGRAALPMAAINRLGAGSLSLMSVGGARRCYGCAQLSTCCCLALCSGCWADLVIACLQHAAVDAEQVAGTPDGDVG